MKEKLKALFDSKATWATFGVVVGSLFGEKAAAIANSIGTLVMVIL